MNKLSQIGVVVAVAILVTLAVMLRNTASQPETDALPDDIEISDLSAANVNVMPRPRLVDLGAGKCIPCKKMAPILEALQREYADTFEVLVIDINEAPDARTKYGVRVIPTQIFFDAAGNELFRHEGFLSKQDILAKWQEFGVAAER